MMRIAALIAVLIFGALPPSLAADAPAPGADPENTLLVDIDQGRVVIRMRPDWAPNHVARIKHLVRAGFFDGLVFHRVIDGFMAQTGDPTGTGTSGSGRMLNAEFTRIPQVRGIVSMARGGGKNSADSQWFIVLGDGNRASLDGSYTAWGQVTAGMEFVDMIHKGNPGRNGAVTNPDHLIRMRIAADAERMAVADAAGPDRLAGPEAAAAARNFSASDFKCIALTAGPGLEDQSVLARLWAHAYLAGVAKARNALTLIDNGAETAVGEALAEACKAHPESFLLTVAARDLAARTVQLPAVTAAFPAARYTCKEFWAARSGADKAQADLVDLWGIAFLQGYKTVGQPGMEIPFDARPQLLGAVAGACAKTPDMGFVDMAGLVAAKVKLK